MIQLKRILCVIIQRSCEHENGARVADIMFFSMYLLFVSIFITFFN